MRRPPSALTVFALGLLALAAPSWTAAEDAAPVGFFDAAADGGLLSLVPEELAADLEASLLDAGRNWTELAEAVRSLDGDERASCARLINRMPHLDRLEMKSDTLIEHVRYAYDVGGSVPYAIPEGMFEPYILTYRIEEEPVDPWRRELFERFREVAETEGTSVGTARAVNEALAAAVVVRDREFFGPRQSPLLTLRSGRGTEADISILACAAMKAVGIPSRQASVPALGEEKGAANWVEVYANGAWTPLYPLEPSAFGDRSFLERQYWRNVSVVVTRSAFERLLVTEDYTETGTIELSFVSGGEPAAGFEHFSVSVLNDGALVPLDELEAVADDEGLFTATVGNGRYVVQAGTRDERGNPFVMMREVTVRPDSNASMAFDVTLDGRDRELEAAELARFAGSVVAWIAFDLESEPSRRMLPLIASALERRREQLDVEYAYMGPNPDDADDAREMIGPDVQIWTIRDRTDWYYVDEKGERHPIGEGGAELPVVRVYARYENRVILHSEGYDLNIERRIASGIDDYLEELIAQ